MAYIHVTLTIFGSTVGYPSDSLACCFSLAYTYVFRLPVVDLGLSFYGMLNYHIVIILFILNNFI